MSVNQTRGDYGLAVQVGKETGQSTHSAMCTQCRSCLPACPFRLLPKRNFCRRGPQPSGRAISKQLHNPCHLELPNMGRSNGNMTYAF